MDTETIAASVEKTGRLLVVDNGWATCGAGAEIVAQIAERLMGVRDLRVQRMGFAQTTCPTTPVLEKLFYPNAQTIAAAGRDLVEGRRCGWLAQRKSRQGKFQGTFLMPNSTMQATTLDWPLMKNNISRAGPGRGLRVLAARRSRLDAGARRCAPLKKNGRHGWACGTAYSSIRVRRRIS